MPIHSRSAPTHDFSREAWAVFLAFLRLGLTSFGGPVAHLGYFRDEFVTRRQWLDDRNYADLVALCQFLPGPASSQVGMAIGLTRAGYAGALAAWLGFTLPSAAVMILFASGMAHWGGFVADGFLHGLKIAAVAVVAQAVWGMGRRLCTDDRRIALAIGAACLTLAWPGSAGQIAAMALAAALGIGWLKPADAHAASPAGLHLPISRKAGLAWLLLFAVLLVGLPIAAQASGNTMLSLFDAFYRAGSLVFGGGHVLLPLLQAEVVPRGWVSDAGFLAGYGAVQAVPGPLFTFAAFLGASIDTGFNGVLNGMWALSAIFIPSFLLVCGALPFWNPLRQNLRMRAAMDGINAGVVGLLLAALYQPVWTGAIMTPADFGLGLLAFGALMYFRAAPWLVVAACGLAGWLQAALL
ncbi:chromate efflux transporter [Pollutimonas sp. M17]|uniref:chromate efflux transporter n=1 Tax=Pollutimonas sp. M17 TaxID=2962065 RepID=UPI0021F3F210|nr:chromate efflux transporter [Pollutimonas sp. M17]UYO92109.1 chromate efflux transporter [Pollutimonas sp. M17]